MNVIYFFPQAYNVLANQCTYESASVCSRVTNIPLSDAAVSCSTNGAKSADPKVCGTYYVCTNGKNVATYCPTGDYYDDSLGYCVSRQVATPVAGCNRCQYATSTFVNAVDSNNCSTYYYCNSQGEATLNTCPADTFFDESRQGCKSDDDLSTYVPLNGACKGATAEGSEETDNSTTDAE